MYLFLMSMFPQDGETFFTAVSNFVENYDTGLTASAMSERRGHAVLFGGV